MAATPTPQALRSVAERVARSAGLAIREAKDVALKVDSAEQHDIKLELDRLIQEQIRREILEAYPDHGLSPQNPPYAKHGED